MRYPEFLKENGTIGFVAPSFGVTTEPYYTAFQNALKTFHEKGYQTVLGKNVYASHGIGKSATPEECGEELMEAYLSEESDVLISVGGGELMMEDLDFIDFEKIAAVKPKWYMGFSDNTNFGFLQATLSDTASLYAPNGAAFGMEPWDESLQDAFDFLTGKKLIAHSYQLWEKESLKDENHPLVPFNKTEKTEMKTFQYDGAPISGRFIGGCMDILQLFAGTMYDKTVDFSEKYKDDGIIWFLESCDLSVFSMRRVLWQLKHAGWFRHVKAFLIGRPLHMGEEMMGLDQYDAVTEVLKDQNVPILMDLDIGHVAPMMPMINGGYGTITPFEDGLQIRFELR